MVEDILQQHLPIEIDGKIGNGRGRAHSFHQFLPGFRAMQNQVFVPGWRS